MVTKKKNPIKKVVVKPAKLTIKKTPTKKIDKTSKVKIVKARPAAKTITKTVTKVPAKKTVQHVKVQTAEGWKRSMQKIHHAKKG